MFSSWPLAVSPLSGSFFGPCSVRHWPVVLPFCFVIGVTLGHITPSLLRAAPFFLRYWPVAAFLPCHQLGFWPLVLSLAPYAWAAPLHASLSALVLGATLHIARSLHLGTAPSCDVGPSWCVSVVFTARSLGRFSFLSLLCPLCALLDCRAPLLLCPRRGLTRITLPLLRAAPFCAVGQLRSSRVLSLAIGRCSYLSLLAWAAPLCATGPSCCVDALPSAWPLAVLIFSDELPSCFVLGVGRALLRLGKSFCGLRFSFVHHLYSRRASVRF